ncbi:MAG TPA: hypothetical protein VMB05_10300 [Solirubrobacteraceae bacterium]|nr:hypothetical protein [Solirubrobacteraceae bacterium]
MRAHVVNGEGRSAELDDGRHRSTVAVVDLADSQLTIPPASPTQETFDAPLP